MAPIERVHTGDFFIALVVIAGQTSGAFLWFRSWKKRVPRGVAMAITATLVALWAVCALAVYMNVTDARAFTSSFRGIVSGIEMLWAFTTAFGIVVYLAARSLIRRAPPEAVESRRALIRTAATAVMIAPVAAIGYGAFIERTRFYVRETELPVPNLHKDLEGVRIAQISDIHAGSYLSVRDVARVVDMTNELRPHLTLVTGDLISDRGDPLDETIQQLARLRADAGVLGCLGNHEVYAGCEDYAAEQSARHGIFFLRHSARALKLGDATLNVAGVDFQSFRHKDRYLSGAEKLVMPGVSNLLLSHNPDVFPLAVRQGFDAVVGGHTHGGQVTIEILRQTVNFARFFTPFVAGLYRLDNRSCYVTAGLGTIGAPVRIGAPPEITLLRLRRA